MGTVVGAGNGVNGSIVAGGTANSVDVFNRRLHKTQEVPILEKKAEELEKRGKAESSTRWIDLLMIAAGGAVDKADEARLNALVQQSKGNDTESERFMEDLNTAKGIVAQLAAQEIPLTWKDGTPIMVKGEKVYAFSATESQKNDPTLFNAANVYGPGAVYDQWRQYGQEQTAQHQNELSGLSTYESSVADASQRLADIAIKGTKDVTPELDVLAAAVPAARGAKTVIELILEKIAARRLVAGAEQEVGRAVAAGGGSGAIATTTVIDTAPMAQRVMDVRAGLPSGLRRSGNVAVAEIDIPGIPRQMAAHSQVSDAGKGLVGSGNGNFVAQSVPNKAGDLVYRGIDTEYKILDNIADQLGGNTSARGTVNILTEKAACASCLNVAEQFKAKYPNITVNILDNQGVMLRPPRKTP
ncbi:hypothetical protein MYA83_00945 [Pseudomonas palleroniana]|uniref:deaminase domain-containing protein n=1 Tax=Pseudomonas palleroniana TaxID=191390 RepID=UPI003B0057FA